MIGPTEYLWPFIRHLEVLAHRKVRQLIWNLRVGLRFRDLSWKQDFLSICKLTFFFLHYRRSNSKPVFWACFNSDKQCLWIGHQRLTACLLGLSERHLFVLPFLRDLRTGKRCIGSSTFPISTPIKWWDLSRNFVGYSNLNFILVDIWFWRGCRRTKLYCIAFLFGWNHLLYCLLK